MPWPSCARAWRPSPQAGAGPSRLEGRQACRPRKKRIERKVGDLFEHRYLFVRRHLTASERKTLTRITRGQPQLRSSAWTDGGGLPAVRSAMPDGDGVGQAGQLRARLRRFGRLRRR